MSTVISRTLKLQRAERQLDVTINIFWPVERKAAWDCSWEIRWPDRQRGHQAAGVDAVQALIHALQMVGAELCSSAEHRAGHLVWREDWSGYGFPVPAGLRAVLTGDDAKHL